MSKKTPKNEEASRRARRSRNKGHGFERDCAIMFRDAGYTEAKRHLEYQKEEAQGIDLDNTGPFRVQCKNYEGYVSINKINEIKSKDGVRVLITKGKNLEPMVVLSAKDFFDLIKFDF